ncbi:MAG TPA: hypothetical protein VMF56_07645 [Acidobacteriaceae bacterium]|nr:hypothetical protein [Acidobacteriaceae bacterium]
MLDLLRDEQAHDLHEGDLDGVGVLENGEDEDGSAATFAVGGEADALVLKALVEKTEAIAAKCGRSALRSIDFDVLTTRWKICHESLTPSPGGPLESSG